MTEYAYRLYEGILQATSSDIILFFVLAAVFFSTGGLMFYKLGTKRRQVDKQHENDKHDRYIEREREIIAVIKENSAAIAANTAATSSLKLFLETSSADTKLALGRIHQRLDLVLTETAQIKSALRIGMEGDGNNAR